MHHGRAVLVQLACACFAAQLARGLDQRKDAVHARVHARQAAAVGVDGKASTGRNAAALQEGATLARGAKAQGLQEQDGVDGEGVVHLGHVHVGCAEPRHREGLCSRLSGRRRG